MDANPNRPASVAVDTNVLLDLAEEVEEVTDAVVVIRRRLRPAQLLMPPSVREELAEEVVHGEDFEKRERSMRAFQLARTWNIQPIDLSEVQHDTARRIGRRVRRYSCISLRIRN